MRPILFAVCALALACNPGEDEHVPANGPPPVTGGTLLVTEDGRFAVAADPDRASIHVVDLSERSARHRIVLGENDEPGRLVEGAGGLVHVVLRRAGEILTIDPASGTELERREVCRAPRGIDVDPDNGELVVACAEGALVRMPASGTEGITRTIVDADLRDVLAFSGGRLLVSRFRSAEILWISGTTVEHRERPPEGINAGGQTMTPTVAWRLRRVSDNQAILVHQHSQSSQLGILGTPSGVYYGGSCDLGVVRSVVSRIDVNRRTFLSAAIGSTSLAVDGDGFDGALVLAAAAEPNLTLGPGRGVQSTGLRIVDPVFDTNSCNTGIDPEFDPFDAGDRERPAIAVATLPDGSGFLTQYRDPAALRLQMRSGDVYEIELSAGRAEDLGHSLFHEAVGTGATCAGCHPEGGDDGHVWLFDVGSRRTQTMTGGILRTAPFHWLGDVPDATDLLDGALVGRMGAPLPPRPDEVDAFERWVDAIPAVPGPHDGPAVDRGRVVFDSAGCAECHAGEARTNNVSMNIGTGGSFQVPALYEIVYHAPYFHDGSVGTLEELVAAHGGGDALSDGDRDDLVSYLRSL